LIGVGVVAVITIFRGGRRFGARLVVIVQVIAVLQTAAGDRSAGILAAAGTIAGSSAGAGAVAFVGGILTRRDITANTHSAG